MKIQVECQGCDGKGFVVAILRNPSFDDEILCPHCKGESFVFVDKRQWQLECQAIWEMENNDDRVILEDFLNIPTLGFLISNQDEEIDYITWYETFGDDFKEY